MAEVDHRRFPRVHAYLQRLPNGLDSYPNCRAKASIYRTALGESSLHIEPGSLPEQLAELFSKPLAAGLWIPEVINNALHLAIADARDGDEDAFVRQAYDANHRLFQSRLYKILMWVATPAMVLRGAHSRWHMFHRGTELAFESTSTSADVVLEYPAHLHDPLMQRCFAVAFGVAAEAGGARDVQFDVVKATPTRSEFSGSWTLA